MREGIERQILIAIFVPKIQKAVRPGWDVPFLCAPNPYAPMAKSGSP